MVLALDREQLEQDLATEHCRRNWYFEQYHVITSQIETFEMLIRHGLLFWVEIVPDTVGQPTRVVSRRGYTDMVSH